MRMAAAISQRGRLSWRRGVNLWRRNLEGMPPGRRKGIEIDSASHVRRARGAIMAGLSGQAEQGAH